MPFEQFENGRDLLKVSPEATDRERQPGGTFREPEVRKPTRGVFSGAQSVSALTRRDEEVQ